MIVVFYLWGCINLSTWIDLENIFDNRQGFGTEINIEECLHNETDVIISNDLYQQLLSELNKYYADTDKIVLDLNNNVNFVKSELETTNNNVSVTQTSTAKPEATQGPLTGLKTKIQNDDELRKIAEHALNNVKVGEKYDVSVYDKLDYIMELIENQNYDHILGTVPGMGGIKNCILDLVDDVTLYYIRKDVGQPGCYIRFSEEYENKPVITADFNVVNESNTRYIATAEKGVANNNKPYGTTQKVDGTVAGTIKKSKLFREKNIDLSSYTLNAEMQIVKDLLLSLNEIGNKEIIISRNSQNER